MKELMTLMTRSIEGDYDTQAVKDARKRWKDVIDLPLVVPQHHLEDTYALLEKSLQVSSIRADVLFFMTLPQHP